MPGVISRGRDAALWLFTDRTTGRIVIAQVPNAALWIFIAAWAADHLLTPQGSAATALHIVEGAALGVWALDEIVRGVNPWRRLLGAGVLLGALLIRFG